MIWISLPFTAIIWNYAFVYKKIVFSSVKYYCKNLFKYGCFCATLIEYGIDIPAEYPSKLFLTSDTEGKIC